MTPTTTITATGTTERNNSNKQTIRIHSELQAKHKNNTKTIKNMWHGHRQ